MPYRPILFRCGKNHVAKVLNSLMYVTAFFVLTCIRIFEYHEWQVKCKNRDTGNNNNCKIRNILTLQCFPIQLLNTQIQYEICATALKTMLLVRSSFDILS